MVGGRKKSSTLKNNVLYISPLTSDHLNENKWIIFDCYTFVISLDIKFSRIYYILGLSDCFESAVYFKVSAVYSAMLCK